MVDKEGTEGEEEAKKAYRAAREESDEGAETAVGNKVSSALINRVRKLLESFKMQLLLFFIFFIFNTSYICVHLE